MNRIVLKKNVLDAHLDFAFNKRDGRRRPTLVQQIDEIIEKNKNGAYYSILNYLKENMNQLLIGNPQTLFQISINIERKINNLLTKSYRDEIKTILYNIFVGEYDYFVNRNTENRLWCAYTYVKELDISICPYCNSQFIFYYENENGRGRTRPVLDHFFEKANFPYLALSIQNLVPCCKVCNSDFKGDQNIKYEDFLHPFEHGFDEERVFFKRVFNKEVLEDREFDYFSNLVGDKTDFVLEIDYSLASPELQKKIEGNVDLFQIQYIYNNFHKPYVQDIILKGRLYNEVYNNHLLTAFSKLFRTKEDLKVYLIPNKENLNKVMLSKLTKDIINKEIDFSH